MCEAEGWLFGAISIRVDHAQPLSDMHEDAGGDNNYTCSCMQVRVMEGHGTWPCRQTQRQIHVPGEDPRITC